MASVATWWNLLFLGSSLSIKDGGESLQANLMFESVVRQIRVNGNDVTTKHQPLTLADKQKFDRMVDINTPVGLQV